MKGQNFNFMEFLAPKILSGEKQLTNRSRTDFRAKLEVGGKMHMFINLRSKAKITTKIGIAITKRIVEWDTSIIPSMQEYDSPSPVSEYNWLEFALIDGFDSYDAFVNYFKGRGKMLCFYWDDAFEPARCEDCDHFMNEPPGALPGSKWGTCNREDGVLSPVQETDPCHVFPSKNGDVIVQDDIPPAEKLEDFYETVSEKRMEELIDIAPSGKELEVERDVLDASEKDLYPGLKEDDNDDDLEALFEDDDEIPPVNEWFD